MAAQTNAPLPDGMQMSGYTLIRKISSGGFSIVYLAEDADSQRYAIKEYLPSTLVKREPGQLVPTISTENLATYRNGLKCFFEEGRALARILHPNVVRVVNFFRANETVYMVMAYEEGRSLQELILRNRNRPDRIVISERHVRAVFAQVMNGLREVHANRMLHLDLKPANIYMRLDGSPMLLDFGAARQTLTADAPKLFPMYTPGFAAPELYKKNQQLGPWTDVYSIGASMFACMMGAPPQPADQRGLSDKMPALFQQLRERYSSSLVDLLDWCLSLDPLKRPQSVFAVQKRLRDSDGRNESLPPVERGRSVRSWLEAMTGRLGRRSGQDGAPPARLTGSR
ncbi:MAG: serine/threonine-protein kinase [Burkholderiaceae bacterium]